MHVSFLLKIDRSIKGRARLIATSFLLSSTNKILFIFSTVEDTPVLKIETQILSNLIFYLMQNNQVPVR